MPIANVSNSPQAIPELLLAQDQVTGDFLKVIAQSQSQVMTGVANLFHDRVLEKGPAIRVLQAYRLVGIHDLGFH